MVVATGCHLLANQRRSPFSIFSPALSSRALAGSLGFRGNIVSIFNHKARCMSFTVQRSRQRVRVCFEPVGHIAVRNIFELLWSWWSQSRTLVHEHNSLQV